MKCFKDKNKSWMVSGCTEETTEGSGFKPGEAETGAESLALRGEMKTHRENVAVFHFLWHQWVLFCTLFLFKW